MTSLKCVHLNSVTRFILITILVSIFSQSFDCKPHIVSVLTSEQGSVSQPIDPSITNDKPSGNNDTKGLTNISQPIDNDLRPQINLNNSLECTSGTCIVMAPPITTDEPSRNNDTNGLNRKRLVVDPSANDFKQTLHVNVRRRSDNRTIFEWPSMEMYPNNENALVSNSSIVENLKKDLNDSLSLSKLNNSLENNNRDTSGNLDVNLEEDTSNDPNPDLKKNETIDAVSSPSSSTSESEIYSENNTFVVTSSTTMEPLITSERSLTPLPPNELEKEQAKPGDQPEITTTSKLMIKTSNPIDEISASTLSNQVTAKLNISCFIKCFPWSC